MKEKNKQTKMMHNTLPRKGKFRKWTTKIRNKEQKGKEDKKQTRLSARAC